MGLISAFLDILFPPKCVFCGRILNKDDDGWCSKCTEMLPYTDNSGRQDGEIFDFCVSPLYYTGVVRQSVLRYKFNGASYYAGIYGKILAECIHENADIKYDIISWVPLSIKRERKRGYDQAMLLASSTVYELGNITNEPGNAVIETLKKTRDVRAQSELGDKVERSTNISGAYIASNPELIKNKRILLIDDVITTGSTLDECTKTLLSAGAGSIICATLARGD